MEVVIREGQVEYAVRIMETQPGLFAFCVAVMTAMACWAGMKTLAKCLDTLRVLFRGYQPPGKEEEYVSTPDCHHPDSTVGWCVNSPYCASKTACKAFFRDQERQYGEAEAPTLKLYSTDDAEKGDPA